VKGKGISASDVAKRADMDRRCDGDGDGCGAGGESGAAATDEEARRHDAGASAPTRAAGGSASLGAVARGSPGAGAGAVPGAAAACCCLGMPGCTSHLNGTVPNAMVIWSLLFLLCLDTSALSGMRVAYI
jgi:hypothetical protein